MIQKDDIRWKYIILFASKSNYNVKFNYSSYEREALTIIWAIAYFQPYWYGQWFILITSDQSLKWLMKSNKFTSKLTGWTLLLQKYDFEVMY